jgi:hypothetical protein
MYGRRKTVVGLLTTIFLTAGLMVVPAVGASAAPVPPAPGPRVNNPLAKKAQKRAVLRKINNAIDAAVPGSDIYVATWNLRTPSSVNSMLRAQKRGVRIHVIVAKENTTGGRKKGERTKNRDFTRLTKGFKKANKFRPVERRSWTKKCAHSCRGTSGIAHTKFYLFSNTGGRTNVVMYGSANMTDLAATNQWNDIFTVIGNVDLYNYMLTAYGQMWKDRPQPVPYMSAQFGNMQFINGPVQGPGAPNNLVMEDLNKVQCTGAGPGRGNGNGKTRIRIAMTAQLDQVGLDIARKLHKLWDQGCDIKIVYAVFGNNVLNAYRAKGPRGGVPIKQVVRDLNHDGVYDFYLHTKFMTIDGVYDGDPNATLTVNGSTNWTQVGLRASDDSYVRILGDVGVTNFYTKFVNYWFVHAPKSWSRYTKGKTNVNRLVPSVAPAYGVKVHGVNPYKNIEIY